MEILILLSLLIIIALLLQDKMVFHKKSDEKSKHKLPEQSSSIMGKSKRVEMHLLPKHSEENSIIENQQTQTSNFNQEINDKKVDIQIPQEELDDVFGSTPDFEEEEEEWSQYQIFDNDDGSATGVTFEELNSVEAFLKEQKLEVSQKETAADIIQKIQGTELFNLLENSIEGASIKIAELLDRSLSSENNSDSPLLQNRPLDEFDIGQFI